MLLVLVGVVCNATPPVDAAYHRNVPDEADVAVNDTLPVPHREISDAVGWEGTVLIVAVTAARALLTQVPLSNST